MKAGELKIAQSNTQQSSIILIVFIRHVKSKLDQFCGLAKGKSTMAENCRFVRQTLKVANQNFLGYYSDTAYGMPF